MRQSIEQVVDGIVKAVRDTGSEEWFSVWIPRIGMGVEAQEEAANYEVTLNFDFRSKEFKDGVFPKEWIDRVRLELALRCEQLEMERCWVAVRLKSKHICDEVNTRLLLDRANSLATPFDKLEDPQEIVERFIQEERFVTVFCNGTGGEWNQYEREV
ncbi:hypothetical protein IQ249_21760 [Lusitaniella coriacea LEGE 07157]|uniref:Uncharacterized protein n=1 Tax=Lusitaniella coriacea LEGE 07157 TaxID=945747 RepID=A0A8J7E039_9CYAN|nr:hypothetical protein [Lusitaniella coriacea]MBE9118520.1 hypothetical protein [Lusitaniella coriacea LEGE 07157]